MTSDSITDIAGHYLGLGFTHVIPRGFDHILFILSIFFLNSNVRSVIIQCSVFTLAHSFTLGLAAAGYLVPNPNIIEPLIAISILFTAIENLFRSSINTWRLVIIFLFGLIHGLGFAGALKEAGIPNTHFISTLLFFNIGVELGQITIILAAYLLVSRWFSTRDWYRNRVVYPVSSIIACIALYWTIERIIG